MNYVPERSEAGRVDRATAWGSAVADVSALDLTLRPLRPLIAIRHVTELCINRPGVAFIETATGWREESLPFADFDWCRRLAKLVANHSRQRIDEESPILSAALPTRERIQIVLPPATLPGSVAITIRRPSDQVWSIEELAGMGLFAPTQRARAATDPVDAELLDLLARHDYGRFLALAVRARKNIVVSGPTGSGKTTCIKALIREIPRDERLITIEDTPELVLDTHPNHVRLFYSKDDQGLAKVNPRHLLEACLRMKPDRILLAELRSDEAFDYLRNVNSGHPGSITSVHASSAELAFEQLTLLVKQSRAGAELSRADIKNLLYSLVDVVVQFGMDNHRRTIREIWFDPTRRKGARETL